jgi:hypothetical protein
MAKEEHIVEAKEQRICEAVAYVPPGEGHRSLWVFGELVAYKTRSEQTGGAYSLFEIASPPGGGPPPHIQHREAESFYLLEGEVRIPGRRPVLRYGRRIAHLHPQGHPACP